MAHEPKLEIYTLKLTNKDDGRTTHFRNSFRENVKSIVSLPKPIEDFHIYRAYHKDFIDSVNVGKGYKKDSKKEKAYKIAKDENIKGEPRSLINSPLDDNFIISGLLEGGKFGIKRNLGDIDDAGVNSDISKNNVVGDRYFFLLYTPLNFHTGILLIQGYSEAKLSDVFREHVINYFKVPKKIDCETKIFIPQSLKEKYLKNAVFSSAKFSSGFTVKNGFENMETNEMELEVKIEIIDKSNKKAKYTNFKKMLASFGEVAIEFPDSGKRKLNFFEKKSAKMKGTSKEFPIDFHDEDNIKPTILLSEVGIAIKDGKVPDFNQIEVYCKNLLGDIITEIMPENAVKSI